MGRTFFSKNSTPTGSGASEKAGSPAISVTAAPKTAWIVRDAFKLPPYCLKNLESQSGFQRRPGNFSAFQRFSVSAFRLVQQVDDSSGRAPACAGSAQ